MSLTIEEILANLSELKFSDYPYKEADELMQQFGEIPYMLTIIPTGTDIVRARVNCNFEVFSKKSDLSYKPAKFNTTFQRASTPNKTMFYGSVNPDANSIEKVDIKRFITTCEVSKLLRDDSIADGEQTITLSKWVTTKEIPVIPTIYNFNSIPKGFFASKLQADLETGHRKIRKDLVQKRNLISDFFEQQFSKVETPHDFDYLLSAIYAERISSDSRVAGVLYPSVRTKQQLGKGFNIAISPEFVDDCLELDMVLQNTIYKKSGMIVCDNDMQAILSQGQTEFTLIPITNPEEHYGREKVYKILNGELI